MAWGRARHRTGIARPAAAVPRRLVEDLAGGQQGRQRSKHGRGAKAPDRIARMKFKEKRPYADVDAAAQEAARDRERAGSLRTL
jgi:hypothetical protein